MFKAQMRIHVQWCFIQQLPLINHDLWLKFFLLLTFKVQKKLLSIRSFNFLCYNIGTISLSKIRITVSALLLGVSSLKRKPIFIFFSQECSQYRMAAPIRMKVKLSYQEVWTHSSSKFLNNFISVFSWSLCFCSWLQLKNYYN